MLKRKCHLRLHRFYHSNSFEASPLIPTPSSSFLMFERKPVEKPCKKTPLALALAIDQSLLVQRTLSITLFLFGQPYSYPVCVYNVCVQPTLSTSSLLCICCVYILFMYPMYPPPPLSTIMYHFSMFFYVCLCLHVRIYVPPSHPLSRLPFLY